jgi:hypothetical protein
MNEDVMRTRRLSLRRRRHLLRNRPDEPRELARDRGGDLRFRLSPRHQTPEAGGQSQLGFSGNVARPALVPCQPIGGLRDAPVSRCGRVTTDLTAVPAADPTPRASGGEAGESATARRTSGSAELCPGSESLARQQLLGLNDENSRATVQHVRADSSYVIFIASCLAACYISVIYAMEALRYAT